MGDFTYAGAELDLFAEVRNWKAYWSSLLRPFITGDVLEVGAGIGSNTAYLDPGSRGRWVCLEPDAQLVERMKDNLAREGSLVRYEVNAGKTESLEPVPQFDTVVYIDVLEHIENDREELEHAAALLRPGGRVIVLSPAHQWLFTPFDAAIGHYRRYNRAQLRAITPPALRIEKLIDLDAAGLLLSVANRVLLRQSMPTKSQLQIWDRWVIPVSRVADRCLFHRAGKSIIGIWKRN